MERRSRPAFISVRPFLRAWSTECSRCAGCAGARARRARRPSSSSRSEPVLEYARIRASARRASLWPSSTAAGIVKALSIDLDALARGDVAPRDQDVVVRVQQQQRRQLAVSGSSQSLISPGRILTTWWLGGVAIGVAGAVSERWLPSGRGLLPAPDGSSGAAPRFMPSFELERLVFDVAVLDREFAALQPGIADEGITVVAAFDLVIEIEQSGAQVDQVDSADEVACAVVLEIVDRVGELVRILRSVRASLMGPRNGSIRYGPGSCPTCRRSGRSPRR